MIYFRELLAVWKAAKVAITGSSDIDLSAEEVIDFLSNLESPLDKLAEYESTGLSPEQVRMLIAKVEGVEVA